MAIRIDSSSSIKRTFIVLSFSPSIIRPASKLRFKLDAAHFFNLLYLPKWCQKAERSLIIVISVSYIVFLYVEVTDGTPRLAESLNESWPNSQPNRWHARIWMNLPGQEKIIQWGNLLTQISKRFKALEVAQFLPSISKRIIAHIKVFGCFCIIPSGFLQGFCNIMFFHGTESTPFSERGKTGSIFSFVEKIDPSPCSFFPIQDPAWLYPDRRRQEQPFQLNFLIRGCFLSIDDSSETLERDWKIRWRICLVFCRIPSENISQLE